MRNIPVGKALVAVEVEDIGQTKCRECVFEFTVCPFRCFGKNYAYGTVREDGKNVIFKLIDLPGDNKTHES